MSLLSWTVYLSVCMCTERKKVAQVSYLLWSCLQERPEEVRNHPSGLFCLEGERLVLIMCLLVYLCTVYVCVSLHCVCVSLCVYVYSVTTLSTRSYAVGDTSSMMLMARQKVVLLLILCVCLIHVLFSVWAVCMYYECVSQLYSVMELVDGTTLSGMFQKGFSVLVPLCIV